MGIATGEKPWIHLKTGDPALDGVTIHPDEEALLSLTNEMIARSTQLADQIQSFEHQFAALRRELEAWTSGHADSIHEAFLALERDHFLFLVVSKRKAHDGVLEDALTDLDMKVAQDPDYHRIPLSVLLLPAFAEEAIRSFLPHHAGLISEGGDAGRAEPPPTGQS